MYHIFLTSSSLLLSYQYFYSHAEHHDMPKPPNALGIIHYCNLMGNSQNFTQKYHTLLTEHNQISYEAEI